MNEEPKTPTKRTSGTKKRKIAVTTPPSKRRLSDNDITTETILKSPQKQSSTYFNNSHHQNRVLNSNLQTASDASNGATSRGRLHIGNEKDTDRIVQEVSPYRKLSPSRKERSESPSNNGKRLSLVQLSPRRKNTKLQQLNHAIQQENMNIQTGGRRLYIYKLTLTNFKSYANEQIIGPFNENFTAVVGPNGSGKSNVIDSMLFVFGFRANKLRQGKLSELIHKSEAYPDLNFCGVDVHFQYNYKDQDIANEKQNDELVITRKAFKNNLSKYYVNGKESTYTKVTELLKEEGIDLDHKRFLILQGEVESIAQMKPKAERNGDDGILEYLEDIIGTSKYKGEIETSITKIEELNDTCVEKNNRVKIVERELKSLQAGKDASIEYLKVEKQYCELRANLCQHNKYSAKHDLDSIELKKVAAEEELKVIKAKQQEIELLASEFKESIEKTEIQIHTLETEEKSISETLKAVLNEKIEAEENKKNNERTQEKNKNLLKLNKEKLELSFKEMEESKEETDTLIEKISNLNGNIAKEKNTYEIERASLQKSSQSLTQQIGDLEQELEPSTQKTMQLTSAKTLKSQEIDLLKEREQKSNDTKTLLEAKTALAEKTLSENENLISKLFSNLASIEATLENKNKMLSEARESFQIINDSYMKQKQQILESKNALLSSENSSKVIKALSKLQEEGKISGFHGRLGNLGAINAKYDVAISTAAPRMNDILVETVECAQKCIEHLRFHKLGYARFILLDKLPNFNKPMKQNFNFLPKGAFRLFDLIQSSKNEFLPAFYSVIRDTIVTDSLSQANSIAYEGTRRLRVVTLDGKLIDISGTMSGGGRQKVRGLMRLNNKSKNDESNFENLFISAEQIKNLEKKFQETEIEFESANFAISQEKNAIEKLENEIPDMKVKISSLQFEITNLENEIVNCKKQLTHFTEQLNKNNASDSEKVEKLLSDIMSIDYEIDLIENNIKPTNEIITSLKEEINQLGGIQLEEKKKEIELMERQLIKLNHSAKKNKALIRKKEIETERLTKSITSITKELESAWTALLEYDKVITRCIEKTTSLNGKKEKLSQAIDDLEKKKERMLVDVRKYDQEMSVHLKRESALKAELEECVSKKEKLFRILEKEDKALTELKIRDVYESLKVLGCLPSSTIEVIDTKSGISNEEMKVNDAIMEIEEEEEAIEKADIKKVASLDTMEIEQNKSVKLEMEHENIKIQSLNHTAIPVSHKQYLTLRILTKEESDEIDKAKLEEEILVLKQQLDSYTVNILTLEDYVIKFKSYKQKEEELKSAIGNRDEVKEKSEQLKKQRYQEFMIGFNIISQSLKEMYQMITMGGNAELELVDSIDPFSEGILFSVMPPKKSWRNISNLSGGEKTLSSLALVFALHNYKPTPIYIMDEIDAALDFKNVSIVANYIKDRTKDAQFIVISLRNNMFELSERLVGIYKNQNMTRSTTLENVDFIH